MSVTAAFWDVDTQRDFIDEDGRLAVPGAAEIVPNLRKLTDFATGHGIPIVASADAHSPDDPEFEQFPPHCVAGTAGEEKIAATTADLCDVADPQCFPEQLDALMRGESQQLVIRYHNDTGIRKSRQREMG